MATFDGIIAEDVRNTIALGQTVYDREGKRAGTVDMLYHEAGYFTVEPPPFSNRERPFADEPFYVPFRLITNIDPRELYVSVTREDLQRDYATPRPAPRSSRTWMDKKWPPQ